jgi:uncharacterized membrane protein
MNFIKYLKSNKGAIVPILLVIVICYGFNYDMFESKEYKFFGLLFDIIVPFAGGAVIAYSYATWYFNKKS